MPPGYPAKYKMSVRQGSTYRRVMTWSVDGEVQDLTGWTARMAVATLAGTGTLSANTQALAELIVTLAGVGAAAGSPRAVAYISADLLPYSELSPQSLANAVWQAEQAAYEATGTFGANLDAPVSSIGGGSITEQGIAEAVWDKETADHVTEGTFGNLMQRLLTVARFLGLR